MVKCAKCGNDPCKECKGTGQVRGKCSGCSGSGRVTINVQLHHSWNNGVDVKNCILCGAKDTDNVPCRIEQRQYPCPQCGGTGSLGMMPCPCCQEHLYKEKYLKYKHKYLELKRKLMGGDDDKCSEGGNHNWELQSISKKVENGDVITTHNYKCSKCKSTKTT